MMTISPDRVSEIVEKHNNCSDLLFFVRNYGAPNVSQRSWVVIREYAQMDRILKKLKSKNKV